MMGFSDHNNAAMPKLLHQCLFWCTSPVVCGLVRMFSSERLGLATWVCSGDVSEDFDSSCPFPLQAEFPGQLASTARNNQHAKLRILLFQWWLLRRFLLNFSPSMENSDEIFRKKVREVAWHPTEWAPPVLYSQELLLSSLWVLCSSSLEGCHG